MSLNHSSVTLVQLTYPRMHVDRYEYSIVARLINRNYIELEHQDGIKMGHLNIRCLVNQNDELTHILNVSNLKVLHLSETRLSSDISDYEVNIAGYIIFRMDRNREGVVLQFLPNMTS